MAQLRARATAAEQKTGEAYERAELAGLRAATANESAAKANEEAIRAQERTKALEVEAAELRSANLATEKSLEGERVKRIALAVSLLPRKFVDQSGAIQVLRRFSNMSAIVEYIDEWEPFNLAEQINFVLLGAGWNVSGRPNKIRWSQDGIEAFIGTGQLMPASVGEDTVDESVAMRNVDETRAAAQAALSVFAQSGLETNITFDSARLPEGTAARLAAAGVDLRTMARFDSVPPRTVLIRIGLRPRTALEQALKELGPEPVPTPVDNVGLSGNRTPFRQ